MDDHSVILGQDFLRLAKAVPVPHAGRLVFLGEAGAWSLPLTTKRKLGRMPRMSLVHIREEPRKSKNLAQGGSWQQPTSVEQGKRGTCAESFGSMERTLLSLEGQLKEAQREIDLRWVREKEM